MPNGLPQGFVLDEPQQAPLPPGFTLDEPVQAAPSGLDIALGLPEAAATIVTGAIAEPIAGLAGLSGIAAPGPQVEESAERIERTREALTFQPRSKRGQQALAKLGEVLAPIGQLISGIEKTLGDATFKATGSPALSAAAATMPTAIIELIGVKGAPGILKTTRKIKNIKAQGKIARAISEAVPTIDQLKDTSRQVFKEIDDAGAVVKREAFANLANSLRRDAKKAGLDPDITPKASKAINRFQELEGQSVTVTELDTLRKVAQNAARSLEPAEASLGVRIIDTVDDFLDKAGTTALDVPQEAIQIGKKYKAARQLWGRARKSELIQESFEKARNQATGFENGIRTQFRSILNNKKQRRFFNKTELDAIRKVVRGDTKENIAKLIGRLGFSEGGATNIIGGALGATAGGVAFGAPGAVLVPIIGQVSRKLAQRMTAKGAEFADQVIRAGKDSRKITEAYLRNTPRSQRNALELSELLMRTDIDLGSLPDMPLAQQARQLTLDNRASLAGALAPTALGQE